VVGVADSVTLEVRVEVGVEEAVPQDVILGVTFDDSDKVDEEVIEIVLLVVGVADVVGLRVEEEVTELEPLAEAELLLEQVTPVESPHVD